MKRRQINLQIRLLLAFAGLMPAACAVFPTSQSAQSPLLGTWATADQNKVTFGADSVVVTPNNGQATTMGAADCNGVYKLQFGRMETASLEQAFPDQPDLERKLKHFLTKPEYPVADVTCDQGGTTYLMLDDRQMIAVYRDAGVGGVEEMSRL